MAYIIPAAMNGIDDPGAKQNASATIGPSVNPSLEPVRLKPKRAQVAVTIRNERRVKATTTDHSLQHKQLQF
jgi:hypothetical protein